MAAEHGAGYPRSVLPRRELRPVRQRPVQRSASDVVLTCRSWPAVCSRGPRSCSCGGRRCGGPGAGARSTRARSGLRFGRAQPLAFYTLSVGKQPRYILPLLAPLAILLARGHAARPRRIPVRPAGVRRLRRRGGRHGHADRRPALPRPAAAGRMERSGHPERPVRHPAGRRRHRRGFAGRVAARPPRPAARPRDPRARRRRRGW